MPRNAPQAKVDATRDYGADVDEADLVFEMITSGRDQAEMRSTPSNRGIRGRTGKLTRLDAPAGNVETENPDPAAMTEFTGIERRFNELITFSLHASMHPCLSEHRDQGGHLRFDQGSLTLGAEPLYESGRRHSTTVSPSSRARLNEAPIRLAR